MDYDKGKDKAFVANSLYIHDILSWNKTQGTYLAIAIVLIWPSQGAYLAIAVVLPFYTQLMQ